MKATHKLMICGSTLLGGVLAGSLAQGGPTATNRVPRTTDPVIYQSEFCTYIDQPPFVTNVKWDHPLIKAAEPVIDAVSRSTMSYSDHLKIYQLDKANDWGSQSGLYHYWMNKSGVSDATRQQHLDAIDTRVARANYENFIKTLLGEYRDYPYMIRKKLEVLDHHTPANKAGAQTAPVDPKYPFDSLTGDGYARLRWLMSAVWSARHQRLNPTQSGFNYGWNEVGHVCNRTDHGVKPFTHAEIRYMFAKWLQGPPKPFDLDTYEAGLKQFEKDHCDPSPNGPDLGYSYDFRGDKNFKANWFESNAFIWISRDAARVGLAELKKGSSVPFDPSYYQHPFATRYEKAKELMGTYLFYPDADQQYFRQASESGGGPQLYIDDEDTNGDGLADFRLFPNVMGQGDIGLASQALSKDKVASQQVTQAAVSTFSSSIFRRYRDWGFNRFLTVNAHTRALFKVDGVFSDSDSNADATFKLRMARINAALDRHTNWGPTQMFSPKAYQLCKRYAIRGAYSPIVAMSYEISKSHNFAIGDFPATHPKDRGKVKWMFFVKFPTRNYYDEVKLRAGKRINWDRCYLNETSLSNDYYQERALDKFGWIPADDLSTSAYLAEANAEDPYYPPANVPGNHTGFTTTINNASATASGH